MSIEKLGFECGDCMPDVIRKINEIVEALNAEKADNIYTKECPVCQGNNREGCKACLGTGVNLIKEKAERCPELKEKISKILQEVYKSDCDDDDGELCVVCLDNFTIDILSLIGTGKLSTSGIDQEAIEKMLYEYCNTHGYNLMAKEARQKLAHAIMEAL